MIFPGQACLQRVHGDPAGPLLQCSVIFQCEMLGQCLPARLFDAKKIDQPVRIQIDTRVCVDGALLLFRQGQGGAEVRRGQRPLAGIDHQIVQ